MRRLTSLRIATRLLGSVLIATLAIGTLSLLAALDLRSVVFEEREHATQKVVDVALTTVAYYGDLEADGTLTREEAQRQAADAVRALRYDGEEYFWIQDDTPTMIMHPIKPELDGTDVSQTADPDGKQIFVEAASTVQQDGSGFVEYQWPRAGDDAPQPKVSYVAGYEPWGWIIGSGIYVDDVDAVFQKELIALLLRSLPFIVVVLVVLLAVSRSITKPLRRMTDVLADGDVSARLDTGANRTELDELSSAINGTLDRVSSVVDEVGAACENLDTSARGLVAVTDELSGSVSGSAQRANDAASAAGTVSEGISSVAAGTVEMGSAISEIAHNAQEAAKIAGDAVGAAGHTSEIMTRLGESSTEIGEFVKVITSIAEQTNLLALNATIEAARAGESGRGFAVVATEVKELASETAKASEDIVRRVEGLRGDASEAVSAIEQISGVITKISEYQTSIAGAVEEQEVTTSEMSRTVAGAATSGEEIVSTVGDVANASQHASGRIGEVRESAAQLAEMSSRLQTAVSVFRH